MSNIEIWITIIIMAVATMITRFIAFICFPANKQTPPIVEYLAKVLPTAVMGLLVVYCLKSVNVFTGSHGISELMAIALVILLQVKTRNSLLSIASGTVLYMLLVQLVF